MRSTWIIARDNTKGPRRGNSKDNTIDIYMYISAHAISITEWRNPPLVRNSLDALGLGSQTYAGEPTSGDKNIMRVSDIIKTARQFRMGAHRNVHEKPSQEKRRGVHTEYIHTDLSYCYCEATPRATNAPKAPSTATTRPGNILLS